MHDPSIREEFMRNKFAARVVLDFSRLETGVLSVRQIGFFGAKRDRASGKVRSVGPDIVVNSLTGWR
jgi:hypothetical protein